MNQVPVPTQPVCAPNETQRAPGPSVDESFPSAAYTSVHFRVVIETEFEEKVRVVGSCLELGYWDVGNAPELITGSEIYPCWHTPKPIKLPLRRLVDYKYVIVGPDGTFRRWEPQQGNRIAVPNGSSMTIEDDEGAGRQLPSLKLMEGFSNDNSVSDSRLYGQGQGVNDSRCSLEGYANVSAVSSEPGDRTVRGKSQGRKEITETIKELQETESIPAINENDTLIIVAFELPVKVVRGQNGKLTVERQKSLVMPLLHALRHSVRVPVKFVGWPGVVAETEQEKKEMEEVLESQDCIPVFLTQEQLDLFFNFCHHCLWPLFHNIVVLSTYTKQPFSEAQWQCYQLINRFFADIVVHHCHETDLVWIHDYHLLLCPQFITRRIRKANVGLFLHIPFPSSEIFRCLPFREEILRGMLCADLIGFHFFEYARHFLVVNKRLLGLEHHFRIGGILELDYGGRNVMLQIGHVHVQYDDLRRVIEDSEAIHQGVLDLRKRYEGRFLFASVDRCEPLAGILLKLRGFQNFLRNYSYARSRAVLVQHIYPTAHEWENQQEYIKELRDLGDEINKEFATSLAPEDQPVLIEIGAVSADEKYALFQAADCLLDTSIRDGLNLNPFEYICCRKDDPAPLILSEFTGCCRALASAMRVNPWKSEDISQSLDRAMNTPGEDMRDRFLRDQMYLQRNSTLQWAEEFLLDLRRARKREDLVYVSWGFGTSYRFVGLDSHFQHLNVDLCIQSFRMAKRSILFFDHEGTLAPDRRPIRAVPGHEALTATGSAPSAQIQECLSALCASGNIVIILSGRDRKLLDDWFGNIPGIGLCAEHGFYFKVPSVTGNHWHCVSQKKEDFTWKDIAMELMKQYVKRTQGAFIENKGSALVFQYRDADPDFGSWQAKELSNYLEELMFGCPVAIMSGKGYVEVKLSGVSKGKAVELLLKKVSEKTRNNSPIDFILCIGDDRSDEEMFPPVNQFFAGQTTYPVTQSPASFEDSTTFQPGGRAWSLKQSEESFSEEGRRSFESRMTPANGRVASLRSKLMYLGSDALLRTSQPASRVETVLPASFSVTVGKKPSNARYYLNDVEEVSELLLLLRSHSDKCSPPTFKN